MKERKAKPPRISADEVEQVRVRRKLEHSFGLVLDAHGRERLNTGTAESRRRYDVGVTGVIRLRLADPLKDIVTLTTRQRDAGAKYRGYYEAVSQSGIKALSFDEAVDGSGQFKDIPSSILDAWGALRVARKRLQHPKIIIVLDHVCGLRMSIREASQATGVRRDAVAMLLSIGLDVLADEYIPLKNRGNRQHYDKIA